MRLCPFAGTWETSLHSMKSSGKNGAIHPIGPLACVTESTGTPNAGRRRGSALHSSISFCTQPGFAGILQVPTRGPEAPIHSCPPKGSGRNRSCLPCWSSLQELLPLAPEGSQSQTRLKRVPQQTTPGSLQPTCPPPSQRDSARTRLFSPDKSEQVFPPPSLPPTSLSEVHQTPVLFRGKVFLILKMTCGYYACVGVGVCAQLLSHVQLFVTPWTVVCT